MMRKLLLPLTGALFVSASGFTTSLPWKPVPVDMAKIKTSDYVTPLSATRGIYSVPLKVLFLRTLFKSSVRALAVILIVALITSAPSVLNNRNNDVFIENRKAAESLYDDVRGDPSEDTSKSGFWFWARNEKNSFRKKGPAPRDTYGLEVREMSETLESYDYSLLQKTKSKMNAAMHNLMARGKKGYREFFSSHSNNVNATTLDPGVVLEIKNSEARLLKSSATALEKLSKIERGVLSREIDSLFEYWGLRVDDIDPEVNFNEDDEDGIPVEIVSFLNKIIVWMELRFEQVGNLLRLKGKSDDGAEDESDHGITSKQSRAMKKMYRSLVQQEDTFLITLLSILDKNGYSLERYDVFKTGGILKNLPLRPISVVFEHLGIQAPETKKSLFVISFDGNSGTSQLSKLREVVTAIVRNAQPDDEVLLKLTSEGGVVTSYGLAASQLIRLKEKGITLTICIELVATFEGYLMCCTGNTIIASPDAGLGGIGVNVAIPSLHDLLKRKRIEYVSVNSGNSTIKIDPFLKITREAVEKKTAEAKEFLELCGGFLKEQRPSLDIEGVATGEIWYGRDALQKGLCDEINTVEGVLNNFSNRGFNIYEVGMVQSDEWRKNS